MLLIEMYLKKRLHFSFITFRICKHSFYIFVMMFDDESDDDEDDGWKILKPGVILFETTIGLV